MNSPGFIPKFGGYKKLLSYQKARVVYKGTVYFIKHWVPRISRTTDQMEQAARSGKQNIVEGSLAAAVSKEMEIKLTGVALASLGELLEDYRDFLFVRNLVEWPAAHPLARHLSDLCRTPGADYETFRKGIDHVDPAISANVLAGLTRVTMRLLHGQLQRLEREFVTAGGLRERMTRSRPHSPLGMSQHHSFAVYGNMAGLLRVFAVQVVGEIFDAGGVARKHVVVRRDHAAGVQFPGQVGGLLKGHIPHATGGEAARIPAIDRQQEEIARLAP
jgi:four helix bundle suffix protein